MPQTIFRVQKSQNFTVLSNVPINDKSLSPGALGVLVYLLSKPDNWIIYNREVQVRFNIGRKKLDRIFDELKAAGYLCRQLRRREDGTIYYETLVYEVPLSLFGTTDYPSTVVPLSVNGLSVNGLSVNGKGDNILRTDSPRTDSPRTEKARTEREPLSLSHTPSLSEMAISVWLELSELKGAKKIQKQAIKELVETVGDFDLDTWRASIQNAILGGCKAENVEAIANTYKWGNGDYGAWQEMRLRWPDSPELWEMEREARNGSTAGLTWYTDEEGKLIQR